MTHEAEVRRCARATSTAMASRAGALCLLAQPRFRNEHVAIGTHPILENCRVFGEEKAHGCEIACSRQLRIFSIRARSCRVGLTRTMAHTCLATPGKGNRWFGLSVLNELLRKEQMGLLPYGDASCCQNYGNFLHWLLSQSVFRFHDR